MKPTSAAWLGGAALPVMALVALFFAAFLRPTADHKRAIVVGWSAARALMAPCRRTQMQLPRHG